MVFLHGGIQMNEVENVAHFTTKVGVNSCFCDVTCGM